MPESAYVNEGECSFEKDMCNWKNTTGDLVYRWQLATITRRPANLPDKTFGAPGMCTFYNLLFKGARILIMYLSNYKLAFYPCSAVSLDS